jgi:hypothetical protein
MNDEEISDEELLQQEKELVGHFMNDVRYEWNTEEKSYIRTKILSEIETQWWDRQEEKLRNLY